MFFVRLTVREAGTETYINAETIAEIRPMEKGGARIYFNFQDGESIATTDVKESPSDILKEL